VSVRRPERWLARRGGGVELLRVPAFVFGLAAGVRKGLYDRGWLPRERVDAPVVSIGNLSAGGTGKTPFARFVARALVARGRRPGVVARGYGARVGDQSDELAMLARDEPELLVVAARDRAAGARELIERGADVILLDDGFQHRRLARELDLVLVDASRPWGLPAAARGDPPVRALLPRGLLREPPSALARADAIVVTRCDQVEPAALEALERELARCAPGPPVLRARHAPRALVRAAGTPRETRERPAALAGREVDLVSGIGNPEAFARTIGALGARVREHREFPDHHVYAAADVAGLGADGRAVVTTAKDAAKLAALGLGADVLDVDIELEAGQSVLDALLDALPRGPRERARTAIHEGLHG